MALLPLPAFQSSSTSLPTHLSAAHHSPRQLSNSCPFPWSLLLSSSPSNVALAAASAAVRAAPALPRGVGRRAWRCRSSPAVATLDGSGAEAAIAGAPQEAGHSRTRLIAQNVPWDSTAEDIRGLFEKHGTVVDVELAMYNKTRNRGLAFITMASEEEAISALNNLNSYQLGGRLIRVEFARTLKKKSSAPAVEPVTRYDVFVGNLGWNVRSRNLRELFAASNPNLMSAEVIFQSNPSRSAGYGFVSFRSKEEAEAAASAFNGKKLMGRAIRVVFGNEQTSKPSGDPSESGGLEEKSS